MRNYATKDKTKLHVQGVNRALEVKAFSITQTKAMFHTKSPSSVGA